jgi:serine phosphatase RsbU (regulator of sigma subunit)
MLTKQVPSSVVLIIEDDKLVRFNIACHLKDKHFVVIEENNGTKGLELARANNFDVVLCDLRMPGMDGLDILRILHQEKPTLPIIVISGTGLVGDAVAALHNGAWDFVTKPIMNTVLEHAINKVLERARLEKENLRYQAELESANRTLREHLKLFQEDADAGRKTQNRLMPPLEDHIGVYCFRRYVLPCLYLTGDFVDYFNISENYIGFIMADASGHGAAAAFITVLLKSFIERYRQQLREGRDACILQPSLTLHRINQDLRQQHLDRYITMFYGIININADTLCYSSGGHFPYPILFDGHSSRFLDACSGTPVGMLSQPAFADIQIELPLRHSIILFSDGILEMLPEERLKDKKARLLEAINQHGTSATQLCESLGIKPNTNYPDDITLLVAERES